MSNATTASALSSQDVMFTFEIGSTDVAVVYVILCPLAILTLIITLLSFCHAQGYVPPPVQRIFGCHGADGVRPTRVMVYFLQMWTLLSDLYLSFTINSLAKPQLYNNVIWVLAILSMIFIIIAYFVNICAALTICHDAKISDLGRAYFKPAQIDFLCWSAIISGVVMLL